MSNRTSAVASVIDAMATIIANLEGGERGRCFASDCLRDGVWVRGNPGKAFVWVVGTYGMHLIGYPVAGEGWGATDRLISSAIESCGELYGVWSSDGFRLGSRGEVSRGEVSRGPCAKCGEEGCGGWEGCPASGV